MDSDEKKSLPCCKTILIDCECMTEDRYCVKEHKMKKNSDFMTFFNFKISKQKLDKAIFFNA